jgi:hypothetical protein
MCSHEITPPVLIAPAPTAEATRPPRPDRDDTPPLRPEALGCLVRWLDLNA